MWSFRVFIILVYSLSGSLVFAVPNPDLSPSPSGETGLIRVASAESVDANRLHVGLSFDFSSVSGMFVPGDDLTQWHGILSVASAPWSFLELWLNLQSSSTSNTKTTPELLQYQGDIDFGVKGTFAWRPYLRAGADLQLGLRTALNSTGYDLPATEIQIRGLLSSDLRSLPKALPLRAHANLGLIIDNSQQLLSPGEELTLAERYALDIHRFHRIFVGAGLEIFPWRHLTPFVEYSIEVPLDYRSTAGIVVIGDPTAQPGTLEPRNTPSLPALSRVTPQRFTTGIRYRPIPPLTIQSAIEWGLNPSVGLGVPSVPWYSIFGTIAYSFQYKADEDLSSTTHPSISIGHLMGSVHDGDTGAPIADAIVELPLAPPTVSDARGRFQALDLPAGTLRLRVRREGFSSHTATVTIAQDKTLYHPVELFLTGTRVSVAGIVRSRSGEPLRQALVEWVPEDDTHQRVTTRTDETGSFLAEVEPGRWLVTGTHRDYLQSGRHLEVPDKAPFPVPALELPPRTASMSVRLVEQRIILPKPLQYKQDALVPTDATQGGLDLLVNFLLKNRDLHIELTGHTDNQGPAHHSLQISTLRAQHVRTYLIDHGVRPKRITARGCGSTRPIAPNLTRAGRRQNHRVDIKLQKDTK